ncbi:MAG: hypothetical protein CME62_02965 [Halobacteriovoraceae bacterium]|nr:hypothetical protein [Halobacteriovoraceae bacterium]|tara:strand:+ start:4084 stop:4563 length:480 start_codon:yes stop_codon:yes gene_type:complete
MNLSEKLKSHILKTEVCQCCERLSIIRHDGICLFSNAEDNFESASISALVSGLWQAAESLNGLATSDKSFSEYRLSFDTTNNGLYVLPLLLNQEDYYLCAIFNQVDNPAKLKRELRVLKQELENNNSIRTHSTQADRAGYLFKDITDEEINKIFEVSGV